MRLMVAGVRPWARPQLAKPIVIHGESQHARARFSTIGAARAQENRTPRSPVLTLYTGTDCQLCDEAKHVLDIVKRSGDAEFTLKLYNIRDDSLPDVKRWRRAYQYDIPVLHLEGKEIARHRIQREDVAAKVRAAARVLREQHKP